MGTWQYTAAQIEGMLEFPCDVQRLANGNTLITDAGDETRMGSEILEVTPTGQIVWRYADGLQFAHSAKRLPDGNTLITDTTNDRLLEVTPDKRVVLDSDRWGDGTGQLSDGSHLRYPNDAHQLADGSIIISDRNNNRCLIADREGMVLWEYAAGISHPHNTDMQPNGNILICDSDHNRIIEVTRDKQEIVWSYGDGSREMLNNPRDADRLDNGNTLICDSNHHRVLEVTPDGEIVWQFGVDYWASLYKADALPNGNILISDQNHHQALEVDRYGNIVWLFRNRRHMRTIFPRLSNGFFKKRDPDGVPTGWLPDNRFAEGGGQVIWDEKESCPGLAYDRPGALMFSQYVAVEPGQLYHLGGKIRTDGIHADAFACLQLSFLDSYGGFITNLTEGPMGQLFTGTNDWTEDRLDAVAPDQAHTVIVRLFMNGPGRAWIKELMMFS
jgi:hypothetical protein